MQNRISYIILLMALFSLSACTIDNLDSSGEAPKTDFNSKNYVLATEDASDVDITTFYSFDVEDISSDENYDLTDRTDIFTNSNPSVSSGQASFDQYIFSQAKDKKGYSSTPGLYRLTLNEANRMFIDEELHISKDNLYPARQISLVNEHLGYFYNEGKAPHSIQVFDPTEMLLLGTIDLEEAIKEFRPDVQWADEVGNNMVKTGSYVLQENQGKLYVSIAFIETASFSMIADDENHFYLAVIDIKTNEVDKIISYEGAKNVGFFVSENKGSTVDEDGNIYFDSWGWNQFNAHSPSKIFRIKSGATDFDENWEIDIEKLFGTKRIAQSIISYNNKIYLHVSEGPYGFSEDDDVTGVEMSYYEFDPDKPNVPNKLDIPSSNTSSRMRVFSIVADKLFIAVPNVDKDEFNGLYSIDREGKIKKEMTIANKYRPTRLFKLQD